MNNLIVGNTSQLSHYFPDDYVRISSRDIDFDYHKKREYDRIFLCFAEQRTFIEDDKKLFTDINVDYTIKVIDELKECCNNVVVYSTCELWNNYEGAVNLSQPYNYHYSPYIESKEKMSNYILENDYDNVIILYPFNFNSPYRKSGFLFSKIFDSILNNKKIEIGNTYFYRDLIHPKYVVKRSMLAQNNELVGSGRLTHVNDFIRELYRSMDMDYNRYVTENFNYNLKVKRKTFWKDSDICLYTTIVKDTIDELKKLKYSTC